MLSIFIFAFLFCAFFLFAKAFFELIIELVLNMVMLVIDLTVQIVKTYLILTFSPLWILTIIILKAYTPDTILRKSIRLANHICQLLVRGFIGKTPAKEIGIITIISLMFVCMWSILKNLTATIYSIIILAFYLVLSPILWLEGYNSGRNPAIPSSGVMRRTFIRKTF